MCILTNGKKPKKYVQNSDLSDSDTDMKMDVVKKLPSHMDKQHPFGDGNYMDTPPKNMNKKTLSDDIEEYSTKKKKSDEFSESE